MAKLKKITTHIDVLSKNIDSHLSYSLDKFMIELPAEYHDFAEGQGCGHDASVRYGKLELNRGYTKDKDKNKFQIYQFYYRGKNTTAIVGTDESIIGLWRDFIKAYYSANQSTEKVILYKLEGGSIHIGSDKPFSGYREPNEERIRSAHNATYEDNAANVLFDFIVAEKRTIGGKASYFYTDEQGNTDKIFDRHDGTGSWTVIPYTPEAEAFLSEIYKGIEGIITKLRKFISKSKSLQEAINGKQKLLTLMK